MKVSSLPDPEITEDSPDGASWLRAFHAGERRCMERCYLEHFDVVKWAVGSILAGADRETVVHEVFFRLLSEDSLRQGFHGGTLSGWLRVIARNQAIDYARRRRLEVSLPEATGPANERGFETRLDERIDVRRTLDRFRTRDLPLKWQAVFVARFVEQQDQPTAARALGMRRTTLAYQEYRIRNLLRKFVLRGER